MTNEPLKMTTSVGTVHIADGEFVDEHGRVLNLRGVNLGGTSKIPVDRASLDPQAAPSFVGRPFPLPEAPLHFRRLRACGFNVVRFIVTWEAIEHAGPGKYDDDYLDYVREVLQVAEEFGLKVYVDPHQDVWSRWTGGDGAPLWTLEVAGFDVEHFRECEAALCRETYGRGHSSDERRKGQKGFPKMIWPTNYFKLVCATMFTLFFAGERYAPQLMVGDDSDDEKVNIQNYLQTHYINAMAELLKRLEGLNNIIGIGTMNEPSAGYINVADLSKGYDQSGEGSGLPELRYGLAPTPYQGMLLGEGRKQMVGEWSNGFWQHVVGKPDRMVEVDPKGKRAWKSKGRCIWEQAGVWRLHPQTSEPELLLPKYFAAVDFGKECYLPFATKYSAAMRAVWGSSNDGPAQPLLIFIELPPLEFSSTPFPKIPRASLPDAVNATHWYDGITLFTRSWRSYFSFDTRIHRPVFGYNNVFKTHVSQLADIKKLGIDQMEKSPTLIGECGIPYDMLHEKWEESSTFGPQLAAMDHTIRCLEENLLSFTLWNYTSDNTNKEGDWWNGEDLSIYSGDQKQCVTEADADYIYDGLRAPRAFVRPYAQVIAGKPLENKFNLQKGVYRLVFEGQGDDGKSQSNSHCTEIFVPKLWCPTDRDMKMNISEGRYEVKEEEHWFSVRTWRSNKPGSVKSTVEIHGPGLSASTAKCKWGK
ncbi:hypothetical protein ACHAWF_011718 [Thalassiosira exigua]